MISPKVSIIIPTYNRPEQTTAAIQSVLNQTFKDFELIVVDDCSTPAFRFDSLPDDTRLRLITLEQNSGVSAARNRGIEQASGEWIAFLDSDDLWEPKKLAVQMKWLRDNRCYRICQTQEIWIRNGKRVNQPKQWRKKADEIFAESLERTMVSPSSVIINRSLIHEVGLFNEDLPACEDYDLWLRICRTESVGLIDQQLMIRHGGAEDQLSATVPVQDRYRIMAMDSLLKKDLCNEELTDEQRTAVITVRNKKREIVVNGFRKRGNEDEAVRFESEFPRI